MRNRLFNLLANNRKRGEFRAETTDGGNVIWLYDQIVGTESDVEWWGGVAADTFVRTLLGMSGPVAIRVNSPGGDVFAARAMAQAMREYPDAITVHVDGLAASAASFITSVADRTVMAPGSMLMIHKAWTAAWGNSDDFAATAELLAKIDGTIADTYTAAARRREIEPANFAALMAAETWLSEDEAIALGLADEIATGADKNATAHACKRWDLSAYTHSPLPADPAPAAKAEPAKPAPEPAPVAEPESDHHRARARALIATPA